MAHIFEGLDPSSCDLDALCTLLSERYGMTSEDDWTIRDMSFTILRGIFEVGDDATPSSPLSSEETLPTTRMPRAMMFRASTFMMRLTAHDEPLVCKIVGTVPLDRYIDIFWENLLESHQETNIVIQVLSLKKLTARDVIFTIQYSGVVFTVHYLHWDMLIRSYQNILDAPLRNLEGPESTPDAIKFVNELQRDNRLRKELTPMMRLAYYYVRAWAICRGFYQRRQPTKDSSFMSSWDIVQGLTCGQPQSPYKSDSPPSMSVPDTFETEPMVFLSGILFEFFKFYTQRYPRVNVPLPWGRLPYAEKEAVDWISLLKALENQSLDHKMGCDCYLKIGVEFMGSDIECGEWLMTVEKEVKVLKTAIPNHLPRTKAVCFWPYRMVRKIDGARRDEDYGTYEGVYIIGVAGLRTDAESLTLRGLADDWRQRVDSMSTSNEESDNGFRNLTCSLQTSKELDDSNLALCAHRWPQQPTKHPEDMRPKINHDMVKPSKGSKSEQPDSPAPTGYLRPAHDVLSRLKTDMTHYKINEWVVGYKDRFLPEPMELPVAEWKTDFTDENFIPYHKILYFKQVTSDGSRMMWDRKTKTDLIFGSQNRSCQEHDAEVVPLTKSQRKKEAERYRKSQWEQSPEPVKKVTTRISNIALTQQSAL